MRNIHKMRHSVEPSDRIFIKDYGHLSFSKNVGKNISKNLGGNCSPKCFDHARKSATKCT